LGLHAVLLALEAATVRFEEVGLDTFAAGARATFGVSSPTLMALCDAGTAIGTKARSAFPADVEPDD